ncbi:GGDEF domain-containing protein [Duganella sp. LX20W]|uniref:diguanylate cyclase n=1 Tax=Rugamonas brunnea TaxID=2758569 RepID=A0A7W2EPW2_9BURK|nr:GGDEF domain-containing protein [Rugamonas brunnea]MBA5636442.1 GGDEF domain-containing protein [Rugamonas brunnea]
MHSTLRRVLTAIVLAWGILLPALCLAQAAQVRLDYRCAPPSPSPAPVMPGWQAAAGWLPVPDAGALIARGDACWLRVAAAGALAAPQAEYLVLQHSTMLHMTLFDSGGRQLPVGTARTDAGGALEQGWRTLLPLAGLQAAPFYLKLDSSNPAFPERVIARGQGPLPAVLQEQQRTLMTTMLASTLLLTSAMFTAAFGLALREREFGEYAGYSFALGLSLLCYARLDVMLLDVDAGWLWQLATPLSTCLLCWLALHFGRFARSSVWLARALHMVIAVDVALMGWSLLALAGVPLPMPPMDRFEFENRQDMVVESLIMLGGWLGWRRAEQDSQDGLLLMLGLAPSLYIDLVHQLWDPWLAPWLRAGWGYTLPSGVDYAIHFNGALTWLPLPAMFCFALARRALRLHRALGEERLQLEARVALRTQELRSANAELEQRASTDELTGLPNRRRMMEWIEHEIERARRYGHELTLCMLDIDHFKRINDEHGHMAGDRALVAIANVLGSTMRGADLIARFGGEEFVLLLANTGPQVAVELVERLRASVAAMPLRGDDGCHYSMTVSVGVAALETGGSDSISRLLLRADQALYRAKNGGRNCVMVA